MMLPAHALVILPAASLATPPWLADALFPRMLVARHACRHAGFARDRTVVAYTPKSKHDNDITAATRSAIATQGAEDMLEHSVGIVSGAPVERHGATRR